MQTIGIICGLLSALLSSVAYFFSGRAVRTIPNGNCTYLFSRVHIVMGIISLIMISLCWTPETTQNISQWLPVTIGGAAAYLLGQFCVIMGQRKIDSSRFVPLMGIKLIFLAIINAVILRTESYGIMQIIAIILTFSSAFVLADKLSGSKISFTSLLWVLAAASLFALSDTFIKRQIGYFVAYTPNTLRSALLSVGCTYTLTFIVGIALFVAQIKQEPLKYWGGAIGFGIGWISCIILLYVSFHNIGTVNGCIAQALRGIFSIIIGYIISKAGYNNIEEKVDTRTLIHRIIAAIMMVSAMVLFNL